MNAGRLMPDSVRSFTKEIRRRFRLRCSKEQKATHLSNTGSIHTFERLRGILSLTFLDTMTDYLLSLKFRSERVVVLKL